MKLPDEAERCFPFVSFHNLRQDKSSVSPYGVQSQRAVNILGRLEAGIAGAQCLNRGRQLAEPLSGQTRRHGGKRGTRAQWASCGGTSYHG